MRRLLIASFVPFVSLCAAAACDSFEEGNATSTPDGSTDAPASADGSAPDGPTPDADAAAAPFCASRRDAGVFCSDFDTEALEPTWVLFQYPNATTSNVALDTSMFVSSPRSVRLGADLSAVDAGPTAAAITRVQPGPMTGAEIEFDIAVEKLSTPATMIYVRLYDTSSALTCAFGLNANVQGIVALVASRRDEPTGFVSASAIDALKSTFQHVTLRWTSSPPEVYATVGAVTLGPLAAPDCVASANGDLTFGLQRTESPVDAVVRIDNVVYSFKP